MRAVHLFTSIAVTWTPALAVAQTDPSVTPAECVVVDPTSTPLNMRTVPNGQVMATIANGQAVRMLSQTKDSRGRPWANIADANLRPLGWVFREYLVCR